MSKLSGFLTGGLPGLLGARAEEKAQEQAMGAGQDAKTEQIALAKKYNEPYTTAGQNALQRIQELLGLPMAQPAPAPAGGLPVAPGAVAPQAGKTKEQWIQETYQARRGKRGDLGDSDILQSVNEEADNLARGGKAPWLAGPGTPGVAPALPGSQATQPGGAKPSNIAAMFEQTPGHQFALQQSEEALNRQAARTGRTKDPSLSFDLQKNAQGLASSTFNTYMDRLSALSDQGRVAAGQITGTGVGAIQNVAETQAAGALMQGQRTRQDYGQAAGMITGMFSSGLV